MGSDDTQVLQYIEKYASVFNEFAKEILLRGMSKDTGQTPTSMFDPSKLSKLLEGNVKVDPNKLIQHQMQYMQQQSDLWQQASRAMMGEKLQSKDKPQNKDRRFAHNEWNENPVFNYIKESYLINAKMMGGMIDAIEFEDEKEKEKAQFFTRQYVNSLSPSNFVLTNPEVCEEIINSQGQNLVKGMQNFLEDLEQSPLEAFKMRQTDSKAFEIGKNLATTPGKVIYQNELIQLIHYEPTQAKCFETPVLVVPPFINKYYVMDLDEKKSLVKGLLDDGYSTFIISWVNPSAELADNNFVDYMRKGPLAALEKIKTISGKAKVNVTGFCVGGTLLSTTVAYLRAIGDESIASLTLLTTLLDFSQPGEVGNYFSEEMMPLIEQNADVKGVFDGRIIGMSFSLLRENSLFWSFFIDNYLKGKDPAPFDILYWNSDSTNITASCLKQYLKLTYWDNVLKDPGTVSIDGVPIDFRNIDVPTYFLSTVADHIVLWQGAYEGTKLIQGPVRFVLAGSGHLAGVINPTKGGKYPHWTNDDLPETAEEWHAGAVENKGSWWPDWHQWMQATSGKKIKPPKPGEHPELPVIMDAPGSYVKKRLE